MSPLEIRLIAYAIVLGLYTWGIHTLDAHHYERVEAAEKLAQANAYAAQQSQVIASLRTQEAATQAAEKQYETLKATADATAQRFSDSLRAYESLRARAVPAASGPAALTDAAARIPCSDPELDRLSNAAIKAALNDTATLTGLQTWAVTSSASH